MNKTFKIAIFSLVVFGGLYVGCGKKDKKAADTPEKVEKKREIKNEMKKPESRVQKHETEKTKRENSHEGSASFSGKSEGH